VDDRGAHAYWVILASFFVALVLAMLPLPRWGLSFRPEWVSLVLIYWCMALPHRVGLVTAACLGIFVDVLEGSALGQNAMALVAVAMLSLLLYQRVRVFNMWQQCGVIFVLVGFHQMICQWIQNFEGFGARSLAFLLPAVTSALLWPLLFRGLRALRRYYRVN